MNNKILSVFLLLLLFIFILSIIHNRKNKTEYFANNWTKNKDTIKAENQSLNSVQQNQVIDIVKSTTNSQLKTLIATQSPLLQGPQGPMGPQGPAGSNYVVSGRLINKIGSYDNNMTDNPFAAKYAVTRTEGTNQTSSLSFMDKSSPFASYQNWYLDNNGNLVNKFDNNCLTMDPTQEKLYMSQCNNDNPNQKWTLDNTNRIISTTGSNNRNLKCIGLTLPEQNVITTNIPGCSGQTCVSNTPKQYLIVKDCSINQINDDELWTFI